MELVKELVSVIVPCYNAENFIKGFIDQIINQTYQNIELILVNDGSTDRTEEIILANQDACEQRGIVFKYFTYAENKGQAYALNLGLKHFTGEYLCWIDCDDVMYSNCLEEKVKYLQTNLKCGFCASDVAILYQDDVEKIDFIHDRYANKKNIFWDILFFNGMPFHPMARSEAFLSVVPDREIATGRAGQNLQMLLPLAYNYEFGYIDKVLTEYVQHKNSHSHLVRSYFERKKDLLNILHQTLKNIKMDGCDRLWANKVLFLHRLDMYKTLYLEIRHKLIVWKKRIVPFKLCLWK